jgi:hypothetical protein
MVILLRGHSHFQKGLAGDHKSYHGHRNPRRQSHPKHGKSNLGHTRGVEARSCLALDFYMRKRFERVVREWYSLASFEIVHKYCYPENDVDME